jgi:hypothetical protein
MGDGAEMIAAERQRQIEQEGWTAEHDDEHAGFEMSRAAQSYLTEVHVVALTGKDASVYPNPPSEWPWLLSDWKPSDDPIRNLVKAGALIAAEIDRLLRVQVEDRADG